MIWTVGHSTLETGQFTELLIGHGIEGVADVRSHPGSRRYPWFGTAAMSEWLPAAGIDYRWFGDLGGRRKTTTGSVNTGWVNDSFRGYADWTSTGQFARALAALEDWAARERVAFMCSEAVPWRCHRQLVATVLVARGWTVQHIMGDREHEHRPGEWGARPMLVEDHLPPIVAYPPDQPELSLELSSASSAAGAP